MKHQFEYHAPLEEFETCMGGDDQTVSKQIQEVI